MSRELLQELLHAAFETQQAQQSTEDKTLGRMIGELDWVSEIRRLKEEINMFKMKSIPDEPMTEQEILQQLEFVSRCADVADYTENMEAEDSCRRQS